MAQQSPTTRQANLCHACVGCITMAPSGSAADNRQKKSRLMVSRDKPLLLVGGFMWALVVHSFLTGDSGLLQCVHKCPDVCMLP